MLPLSIALIPGSTRPGRFADKPVRWLLELATQRQDMRLELLDLRDYPLPFFEEAAAPAAAAPRNEVALRWAAALARFDGFIFVTPEYNHGVSAVLKNALDYAYAEWARKPAAFVGYGALGAARTVQSLRLTACALRMAPLGRAVHVGLSDFQAIRAGKDFADFPHLAQSALSMLEELAWWGVALRSSRQPS